MKARILGLLATVLLVGPMSAQAVVFQFVCSNPADCDGDSNLSLSISLASSVINPGGSYFTTSDSAAGFLGWSATSSVGNGFSISGGFANLLSVDAGGLEFTFDSLGVLTGIKEVGVGTSFTFNGQPAGAILWIEPNTMGWRRDVYPGSVGSTLDDTDIVGTFTVPEPGTLALLGLGFLGVGLLRRRKVA